MMPPEELQEAQNLMLSQNPVGHYLGSCLTSLDFQELKLEMHMGTRIWS